MVSLITVSFSIASYQIRSDASIYYLSVCHGNVTVDVRFSNGQTTAGV
jgi:hypothetical protein